MFGFTKKRKLEIKSQNNKFIWECSIPKKEKIVFSVDNGCEYYIYNKKTKNFHQFRSSGYEEVINPSEQRVFGALTTEHLSKLPIKFFYYDDRQKFSFIKKDKEFEASVRIDGNMVIAFENSFVRNILENRVSTISSQKPLYIELFNGMSINDFTLEQFFHEKLLLNDRIGMIVYKELKPKPNSIPLCINTQKIEDELKKEYFKTNEALMQINDVSLVDLKLTVKSEIYDILEENQNKAILHKSNKEVLQEELEATKVACEINKLRNEDNE